MPEEFNEVYQVFDCKGCERRYERKLGDGGSLSCEDCGSNLVLSRIIRT